MAMVLLLHERWFTEGRFPIHFEEALTSRTLIPVAIALSVTAVATLLWRLRGRRQLIPGPIEIGMTWNNYQNLLSWMPMIIGVHTAVLLMVSGIELQLFVPNLRLPWHIIGGAIGLAEIVIALSFLYGALTRFGAILLAVIWLAGAVLFGPLLLLEHLLFLGIAFFLFATGRGPLAIDMTLQLLHKPAHRLMPYAVPVLRALTGASIVVLAFTEKLWNVPLGLEFLASHRFNFFPALGLHGITDRDFLLIAGTVELTFGLLLASGAFVRLTILILWVPFNLTLPFLGWRELVGHLPIYGIMALLLIWGEQKPETEAAFVQGVQNKDDDTQWSGEMTK